MGGFFSGVGGWGGTGRNNPCDNNLVFPPTVTGNINAPSISRKDPQIIRKTKQKKVLN